MLGVGPLGKDKKRHASRRNPAKPAAFALRLFIDRGQGWKICLSVHTEIGAGRAAEGE